MLAETLFDELMIPTIVQSKFLPNETNKRRFMSMLKNKSEEANFFVKQA